MTYKGYIQWTVEEDQPVRVDVEASLDAASGIFSFTCTDPRNGKFHQDVSLQCRIMTDDMGVKTEVWEGDYITATVVQDGQKLTWRGHWMESGHNQSLKIEVQPLNL